MILSRNTLWELRVKLSVDADLEMKNFIANHEFLERHLKATQELYQASLEAREELLNKIKHLENKNVTK